MCRKQPGIAIGRLCDKCDGKCPVCDSYVRPTTLVRICDECSFGNYQNKCVVCGGEGISDAFYCFECTRLEKDRDGCPKIINLGSSRTDVSSLDTLPHTDWMLTLLFSYSTKRKRIGQRNTSRAEAWAGPCIEAFRAWKCIFKSGIMGVYGAK
jgi:PHD finger-like domain-containing protein 5A